MRWNEIKLVRMIFCLILFFMLSILKRIKWKRKFDMKVDHSCSNVSGWNLFSKCRMLMSFFFSIIKNCAQRKNVVIRCANERFRRCISLIANFVCDYEKQMLIIDVKNEQHCIICRVSSKAWKNLQDRWSLRTHEFMQEQIRRQQLEQLNSRNEKWIYEMKNLI